MAKGHVIPPWLKNKGAVTPKWITEKAEKKRKRQQSFYTSKVWRITRKQQLRRQPDCEDCLENNLSTKGTVVDHTIPIEKNGSKLDPRNHRTMCDHHHAIKRNEEKQGKWPEAVKNEAGELIPKARSNEHISQFKL